MLLWQHVNMEKLAGITAQHSEIVKRVVNGSLDIDKVRKALQYIIEGKFPEPRGITIATAHQGYAPSVPSWYVSPEQQLERVRQLNNERGWGFSDSDFPSIPEGFTPRTSTEVLLLCVYLPSKGRKSGLHHTFDELWDCCEAPTGYTKWRWDELKATAKRLRQAPGYDHTPGIRWVAFDPNTYHGLSPEAALKQSKVDGVRLAGTEVLMAALLFPTWATSWNGDLSPYPNLSALQFYWDAGWSLSPCLFRWDGDRQLRLSAYWADYVLGRWSSPVAREC